MKRLLAYLLCATLFIVLQATVFPLIVGTSLQPNLLLLLVLYLGLYEKSLFGAFTSWLLGCMLDVFSGTTLGLYGMIMLLTFCITCVGSRKLNFDSDIVIFVTTLIGTAIHAILLILMLIIFATAQRSWCCVLPYLPVHLLVNQLAVLILLPLVHVINKRRKPSPATSRGDCAWL